MDRHIDWTQTKPADVAGWYLYTRPEAHDERAVPVHARYVLAYFDRHSLVHSNGESIPITSLQGHIFFYGPIAELPLDEFINTPEKRQRAERDAQDRQALAHHHLDRLAQAAVYEDKATFEAKHDAAIEDREEKGRESAEKAKRSGK